MSTSPGIAPSPKLLIVVSEDWYFVSHRLALGVAARAAGYEVAVVTRPGAQRARIEAAGLRVLGFALQRRGLSPLGLLREAWALARIYWRERPDLVHHVALRPVVVGALAARLAGVRGVVSAVTGMGFLFTDGTRLPWVRRAVQRALPWLLERGLTIVQNDDDARALQSFGLPPERLRLVAGAGVDTQRYAPGLPPHGAPVVMLAARLLRDKGVTEFVAAARALQGSGARFVLVGDPDPDNPATITQAELDAWVAEGVVEWWGPSDNMPATLRQAQVFCLPSYREGLPKVVLEAMACGLPCISTDAPGCRDAVRHGDNGLLVPVKDAPALAAAIQRLLGDAALRQRMGARGSERAESEFSQQRVIEASLAVYAEVRPRTAA
ncbi:MAG: glycosyltransferase family 4 protein [Pseudomonadota bacterium]